jgi:endonuclease-3
MEMTKADIAHIVMERLSLAYPAQKTFLAYRNPFELLVGAILSAQCTDAMVNRITPKLFCLYPDMESLAVADSTELEGIIHSAGFYRDKAKNLQACARELLGRFKGVVPSGMEELCSLPGVGRKTANVVRSHIFGLPSIIVDTHFSRVTRRLRLAESENPSMIEREMQALIPEGGWSEFSMTMNAHGRKVCAARKPLCCACVLSDICISCVNECKGCAPIS